MEIKSRRTLSKHRMGSASKEGYQETQKTSKTQKLIQVSTEFTELSSDLSNGGQWEKGGGGGGDS